MCFTTIFSSQYKLDNFSENLTFSVSKEFLVKGFYHLSVYIYKPGSTAYDVVERCCDFVVMNNNAEFAHLETFNIGKVYNKNVKWER